MNVDQAMTAIVDADNHETAMRTASMLKRATLLELADQLYLNDYEEMKRKKLIDIVVRQARGTRPADIKPEVTPAYELRLLRNEWHGLAALAQMAADGEIAYPDSLPAADYAWLAKAIRALTV